METVDYKAIIKDFLKKQAIKAATLENIRAVFKSVLEPWAAAAQKTATGLDDWVLDALLTIVEDDEKMQKVVDFLRSKLCDGICADVPEEYEALAYEVTRAKDPETIDTARFWYILGVVRSLVKVVVPVILEYLKENGENEK